MEGYWWCLAFLGFIWLVVTPLIYAYYRPRYGTFGAILAALSWPIFILLMFGLATTGNDNAPFED